MSDPENRPKFSLTRRDNPDEKSSGPVKQVLVSSSHPESEPGAQDASSVFHHAGLQANQARILLVLVVLFFLVGLVASFRTMLIGLAVSLVISSSIWAAADMLARKQVKALHAVIGLYAMVVVVLFAGLVIGLPAWQTQSQEYGAKLLQLTGKLVPADSEAARANQDPAPAPEPAGAPAPDGEVGEAAPVGEEAGAEKAADKKTAEEELLESAREKGVGMLADTRAKAKESMVLLDSKTSTFVEHVNKTTQRWRDNRISLFLQLCLLTASFGMIPLIRLRGPEAAAAFTGASYGTPGRMEVPGTRPSPAEVWGDEAPVPSGPEAVFGEEEAATPGVGKAPVFGEPKPEVFGEESTPTLIKEKAVVFGEDNLAAHAAGSAPVDDVGPTVIAKGQGQSFDALRRLISEAYIKLSSRIGSWCMARLVKAVLIGAVVSIAFNYAGIATPLFIGGCVCVLAFFTRVGHLLGLILALPMVLFADDLIWALGGLLIAWGVLYFVEKKLNWYLVTLPELKRGHLPGHLQSGGGGGVSIAGGAASTMKMLYYTVRIALSVAILGGLAYLGFAIVPRFMDDSKLDDERRSIEREMHRDEYDSAIKKFEDLLERRPGDVQTQAHLVQCYVKQQDFANALKVADRMANPPAEEPSAESSQADKLYERVKEMMYSDSPRHSRSGGYRKILNSELLSVENDQDDIRLVAGKLLEISPDDPMALKLLAQVVLTLNDADGALAYIERAGSVAEKEKGWNFLKAEAWSIKRDWAKVVEACEAEIQLDPGNRNVVPLKVVAERELAKEKLLNDPAEPPPEPPQN